MSTVAPNKLHLDLPKAPVAQPIDLARQAILAPSGLDDQRIATVLGSVMGYSVDYADLYFEYFRAEPSGARVKLAWGEHRMAWLTRDAQWRPVAAALPESIRNGFLSSTASHG